MRDTKIPVDKLYHEQDCAEIYVALREAFGNDFPWVAEEYMKFRPDRSFVLFGKQFYIEMERGTQDIEAVKNKINNYIGKEGTFFVIFVVKDYQPNQYEPIRKTAHQTGNEILNVLKEYYRANQFTVAHHQNLVKGISGQQLFSPLQERFSLMSISRSS